MVEVKNGKIKKNSLQKKEGESMFPTAPAELPAPAVKDRAGVLCTGIGGTGVVTIGALVGMAGHLEGKGVQVLDEVGLAQKGGAVVTHVQVAPTPGALSACRVDKGEADTVLAFDLVTAAASGTVVANFDDLALKLCG